MGQWVWELGIFHLLAPVQEKKGTRPYLPAMALAVDKDTGLILSTKVLGSAPPMAERQGLLVEMLETADMLPAEIVVDTAMTARLIESITTLVGIKLSVGATLALDEAKEGLTTFIG